MVKNFFEYVKELIPEKGEIFFTFEKHEIKNDISLYQLADLLMGKKISFAEEVCGYSWRVNKILLYPFPVMGIYFLFKEENPFYDKEKNGDFEEKFFFEEKWIHFSRNAFIGAICIVATKNNIIFDDSKYEKIRQAWERKLDNKEKEEDKQYTDLPEANFNDSWYYKDNYKKRSRPRQNFQPWSSRVYDINGHLIQE